MAGIAVTGVPLCRNTTSLIFCAQMTGKPEMAPVPGSGSGNGSGGFQQRPAGRQGGFFGNATQHQDAFLLTF